MDRIKPFEPLFGEWYAESLIGVGSFGRVYKVYREELGNRFVSALKYISIPSDEREVKQLRSDGMDDDSITVYYRSLAQELSEETALMSKLRGYTNIVSFEYSRIIPKKSGVGYDVFIIMELLESLTDRMVSAPLSADEVVRLGLDISRALSICAKHGIIHRDVKPDNIFVSENGDYELGDFGIARQLEKTATFMSKKGTYGYMAPEVYKGEKYGATCDIYSLGVVMYRLLNKGRLPFLPAAPNPITPATRENALARRMSGQPLPPPCDADAALSRIVLKACAYEVKDRFASAQEMYDALSEYRSAAPEKTARLPVPDEPAGPVDAAPKPDEYTAGIWSVVLTGPAEPKPRPKANDARKLNGGYTEVGADELLTEPEIPYYGVPAGPARTADPDKTVSLAAEVPARPALLREVYKPANIRPVPNKDNTAAARTLRSSRKIVVLLFAAVFLSLASLLLTAANFPQWIYNDYGFIKEPYFDLYSILGVSSSSPKYASVLRANAVGFGLFCVLDAVLAVSLPVLYRRYSKKIKNGVDKASSRRIIGAIIVAMMVLTTLIFLIPAMIFLHRPALNAVFNYRVVLFLGCSCVLFQMCLDYVILNAVFSAKLKRGVIMAYLIAACLCCAVALGFSVWFFGSYCNAPENIPIYSGALSLIPAIAALFIAGQEVPAGEAYGR